MKECRKCHGEIPSSVVVDGKRRSLDSRVYCLKCSPFGILNRKRLETTSEISRQCPRCKLIKSNEEFYQRKSGIRKGEYYGLCRKCSVEYDSERKTNIKLLALKYKGNKCSKCGYDKCAAALDFHHVSGKEFLISICKGVKLTKEIKRELDRCVILCANCHRELHSAWSSNG